jgi:UDP-N-acetylglucosamine 1-carboxyvinyltransferase
MTTRSALEIVGGRPLRGEVAVHAAKNSALYLILASLLTEEPLVIEGVPRLSDVLVGLEILEHAGVEVTWAGPDVRLHAHTIRDTSAPYRLVSKMRASFVVMGALLGRAGEARISMPGGCAFGPRPVDRHLKAFAALGVEVADDNGDFVARRRRPLAGRVVFEAPTVGGTQNVLLATAVGQGEVEIENAALEPEIADLAELLNLMGARIEGAGTPSVRVRGVERLHGARFRPIPDRIEAGTFMLATAATRGDVTLRGLRPDHLRAVRDKLAEAGVRIVDVDRDAWRIDATGELTGVDVTAVEYPGIPTDLQAPFGAFLATVPGVSVVRDRVYPDRFTHVAELQRMGARLDLTDRTLVVRGGALRGTDTHAADLRAGGALVVAALAADGRSRVTGVESIDRGYERFADRLRALGASIELSEVPAASAASGRSLEDPASPAVVSSTTGGPSPAPSGPPATVAEASDPAASSTASPLN